MILSKVAEKETALLDWADTRSHPWQYIVQITSLKMVSIRFSDNAVVDIPVCNSQY